MQQQQRLGPYLWLGSPLCIPIKPIYIRSEKRRLWLQYPDLSRVHKTPAGKTLVSTGFCFHFVPISPTSNLISLLAKFRVACFSKLVLCAPVVLNILLFVFFTRHPGWLAGCSGLIVKQVFILYPPRTAGPNHPWASSQNIPKIQTLGPEHSHFLRLFFVRPIPALHHSEYIRLDTVSVQAAQRVNSSHGMVEIPRAQNLTVYYPLPCQAVGAVIINVNLRVANKKFPVLGNV